MFKELLKYRDLLFMLTLRNIRIRYKQAVMGFLWAIFMPAMIVLSGIFVKKAMSMFSGKPLDLASIVSVSIKALPWAFFVSSLKFSVNSLTTNMNLVTKIYFPRAVLPLSSILASLFDFSIATVTLTAILIFAKIEFSIYLVWLPLLLVLLILITTALGMILSCANLFFRDVRYIVEVILMFGIFFTPVFYEASMFEKWKTIILLNPIGAILENINRVVVLHQMPDFYWLGYAAVWAVLGFMCAWNIFHRKEYAFAENI